MAAAEAVAENIYRVAAFLDIKGAFDNVFWPTIMESVKDKSVLTNLIKIIKSYLADTNTTYNLGPVSVNKRSERGSSQESQLGTNLWSCAEACAIYAYADDIAIKTRGSISRNMIEERLN